MLAYKSAPAIGPKAWRKAKLTEKRELARAIRALGRIWFINAWRVGLNIPEKNATPPLPRISTHGDVSQTSIAPKTGMRAASQSSRILCFELRSPQTPPRSVPRIMNTRKTA